MASKLSATGISRSRKRTQVPTSITFTSKARLNIIRCKKTGKLTIIDYGLYTLLLWTQEPDFLVSQTNRKGLRQARAEKKMSACQRYYGLE